MNKLNIAVFFGGCSSEYGISLESSSAVIGSLNTEKYNPVLIGISNEGKWYYYTGDIAKIKNDTWQNSRDCIPAILSPDRKEHKLLLLKETSVEAIPIDVAFPVLHGKNGEDGTVQGTIELAGIPLAGCGVAASALCMDKDRAHKLAGLAGVRIPSSLVLSTSTSEQSAVDFAEMTGYPLYVKPVKAGSSYGITKVQEAAELLDAITLAFHYDDQVIIEENIEGFEVGCAVLGTHELIIGEVDEIEISRGFFDFTEKYTQQNSTIHVPARISRVQAEKVKETAKRIYKALGCSGFARVDMFLTPSEEIVFNEVNTIPGFTEHSRFPGMMKAAGYSFKEVIEQIIEQAVKI
ncbi:MAG: D-alanine--D-serine ligase VanG [Clostridiales bacterium]|nr:D-alanine--D-serine ligase VanG [Clostridiales bacterium]